MLQVARRDDVESIATCVLNMVSFQRVSISLVVAVVLLVGICLPTGTQAFSVGTCCSHRHVYASARSASSLMMGDAEEPQSGDEAKKEATRLSLEEKMAKWEATEEEIKAATLGGVVPKRADSFDVGLYVAFPFMVIGCFLFLAFPFLADKIDVSSVGPPPTS